MLRSLFISQEERLICNATHKEERIAHRAFTRLIEQYKNRLGALCWRILRGDRQRAEDALQEAVLRAYEKRGLFHIPPAATAAQIEAAFANWLYTITRNVCFSHLHSSSIREYSNQEEQDDEGNTRSVFDTLADPTNFEEQVHAQLLLTELEKMLPHKPLDVQILHLHYLAGLSQADVGAWLGCTRDKVRDHLERCIADAFKKIRRCESLI